MAKKYLLLILILIFAGFLLFFKINSVPAGLNNDQVSEGYNAYSIIKTGADRYGMIYPLMFRSLGTYLLPLYTYLTAAVFSVFGVSQVGVNLVSIISGLVIVFLTFLIFKGEDNSKEFPFSVAVIFVLSFTPWLIFFSRSSTEVTLGLAIFLISFYLFIKSPNKPANFIIGCLFLGISSWAYYFERIAVYIFLPIFIIVFRKKLVKRKGVIFVGIAVFLLTQVLNLLFVRNGAITRRFSQVSYFSRADYIKRGDNLRSLPFGQLIYISKEFASHYISYFSPRSLFFDPDDQTVRSMPGLSVFYNWMIMPFIFGIAAFVKRRKTDLKTAIVILLLISPIPAALTVEPFYTMRVLLFLWVITVIITYGIIKFPRFLLILLFVYSLFSLYSSYFVLFRYEREGDFGKQYSILMNIIQSNQNEKFVVDNSRDPSICIRLAFLIRYDPRQFQKNIGQKFLGNYYTNYHVGEDCTINNIEVRQINWSTDIGDNIIMVGDPYAISDKQAKDHNLKLKFKIIDSEQNPVLAGYSNGK